MAGDAGVQSGVMARVGWLVAAAVVLVGCGGGGEAGARAPVVGEGPGSAEPGAGGAAGLAVEPGWGEGVDGWDGVPGVGEGAGVDGLASSGGVPDLGAGEGLPGRSLRRSLRACAGSDCPSVLDLGAGVADFGGGGFGVGVGFGAGDADQRNSPELISGIPHLGAVGL